MTRQSSKQRGITLVEVVLTLGISTLLIATVLAGRNSVRSQAQFSDGVERIKETILTAKSQANTSNNVNEGATGVGSINGGSNQYLNIGRSIRFTPDSAQIQVITILCYADPNLLCTDELNEDGATDIVTDLPWGITFKNYVTSTGVTGTTELSIVFTRDDKTGSFNGYWMVGRISDGTSRTAALVNSTPITLNFESTDGRTAKVDVNPATGTVTRTVNQ